MAKFEIKFKDRYIETDFIKVEMYKNNDTGESSICFEGVDFKDRDFLIMLDKSTAIKFAKTLRTEINKIKEV